MRAKLLYFIVDQMIKCKMEQNNVIRQTIKLLDSRHSSVPNTRFIGRKHTHKRPILVFTTETSTTDTRENSFARRTFVAHRISII